MQVRRLKFGYEVSDIDYTSIHHANFIKEKIGDGRFVIVKNSEWIHPDVVATLYRNIGTLGVQPEEVKSAVPENRAFCRVTRSNMFHGGEDGEIGWHNAIQNRVEGDHLVCMYMQVNECAGGDTAFTDAQSAFQDLSEEDKVYWEARQAQYNVHIFDGETEEELTAQAEKSYFHQVYYDVREAFHFVDADGKYPSDRQAKYKDIVTVHPLNGKKGFYFPLAVVKGFKGYDYETGQKMKYKLIDHLLQDKYVYWHKWDLYDICFSDQLHSLHKRNPYEGPRELWRSGIMYK